MIHDDSILLDKRAEVPLSLYIHIPWCVKKCPYCDFNSYAIKDGIPEADYIDRLILDLKADLPLAQDRSLKSIFFGGGTPSLFSPQGFEKILNCIDQHFDLNKTAEITMEANPGTVEHRDFRDYKMAGITRISLGAQSFQNSQLEKLGRVHQAEETMRAIDKIVQADFKSFNIDIMYGLPDQSLQDALFDLKSALFFDPPHLSWYNLTIEPNTIFHHNKPPLPTEDVIFEMQEAGFEVLKEKGYKQYEVSAFSKPSQQCQHNLNYWQFGDYLGIGAGAHGKITDLDTKEINRYSKIRFPKSYLDPTLPFLAENKPIPIAELPLEFMLNALRLNGGFSIELFESRTFMPIDNILIQLQAAQAKDLLSMDNKRIMPTELGKRFLNDLIAIFLG